MSPCGEGEETADTHLVHVSKVHGKGRDAQGHHRSRGERPRLFLSPPGSWACGL
ncbi:mCG147634 [Mus musculus]|nr:mCG147634 [Mus musculus]